MLNTRDLVIAFIVGATVSSFPSRATQAGLFDFLQPKAPVKGPVKASRGQSPGAYYGATAAPVSTFTVSQPTYSDASLPSGWGYDSSPCFNCGDCDHCIWCRRHNLK